MKPFKIQILILLTGIIFSSCKTIMMKMNGVTNPRLVTESQTISYLNRKGFTNLNSYFVCRDSLSEFKIINMIKAIPETNFFNNKGELLVYGDSICPGLAAQFSRSLIKEGKYRVNSAYSFGNLMKLIRPVEDGKGTVPANIDYIVVFYWAKFVGNINDNVFELGKELNKNKDLKIHYVFVNVDFLKSWGMKKIPEFNFH
jgi:hypothetical protein